MAKLSDIPEEETVTDALDAALETPPPEDNNQESAEHEGADEGEELEVPLEGDDEEGEEGEDDEESELEDEPEEGEGEELGEDGKPKKPEGKKPDAINDPIPKDLKKDTRERMQSLINTARERTVELQQVRGEYDQIVNGIKATGTSPEQYGEVLSWMGMFNSPNREAKLKAYELAEDVCERMATMLGVERKSTDPLAAHPDLQQAVANKQITPTLAKEMARSRNQQKFNGDITQHNNMTQQQQQAAVQERNTAKASLNSIEAQLKKTDPLYDRKRAAIVPILRPVFQQLRPSQWAAAFQEAYKNVRLKRTGNRPNGGMRPKGQPMRGKNPAGTRGAKASSPLEAVNAALASLGGK